MQEKDRKNKILAITVLLFGILAVILAIVGLYIRLSGTGNPVGSVYIYIGVIFAIGGGVLGLRLNSRPRQK